MPAKGQPYKQTCLRIAVPGLAMLTSFSTGQNQMWNLECFFQFQFSFSEAEIKQCEEITSNLVLNDDYNTKIHLCKLMRI